MKGCAKFGEEEMALAEKHLVGDLKVFFNQSEYIIAATPLEASVIIQKTFGADHLNHEETGPLEPVPMDTMLTVFDEDEDESRKQTALDWIVEKGRGYLCSVDF